MFALDGAGALLSIVLLGVVLPILEPWLGMPKTVLQMLVFWPVVCLVYDIYCFNWARLTKPGWLRGIMVLNTLYCAVTAVLIGMHLDVLTTWGTVYFITEIPVIMALVAYEHTVCRRCYQPIGN